MELRTFWRHAIQTGKLCAFPFIPTRYPFSVHPSAIYELMDALKRGEGLEGDVLEVGVARGTATVFLNRFLDNLESRKRYWVVDTFSGFVREDAEYEIRHRAKSSELLHEFGYSRKAWERNVLVRNGISRVTVIEDDIKQVGFDPGQRFSTVFLDVDLYLPTRAALGKIIPQLVEGGTVVMDDVVDRALHDGAWQAFQEFSRVPNGCVCSTVPPNVGVIQRVL